MEITKPISVEPPIKHQHNSRAKISTRQNYVKIGLNQANAPTNKNADSLMAKTNLFQNSLLLTKTTRKNLAYATTPVDFVLMV